MVLRERLQWVFRMAVLLFILSSVAFLSALTAMRFAVHGREVNLPADTIVRQSPPPNMRVKTGQSAHVVLSLGPQKISIPQLQDRSLRAAQVELMRGGMQLGEVSSVYLPGDVADTVTAQDPAPGNTEVTGPHVNLLVSLGPRPAAYVMPELTGLPIAEAQAKLGSAGLRLSKLTPQPNSDSPVGTIVAQTPARGQRVESGSTIELQVAE
jgi:eukaryotic-like serine/threonine-protein kinase